jgi:hypothetical protein
MNQIPEEPSIIPTDTSTPVPNPATFVPENSSPQADVAALQAIGALEAEEDTTAQDMPPTVTVMTPFVPEQPLIAPKDVPSAETLQNGITQPAQTNTNPFAKQEKSSKPFVLIIIAAIVLIGAVVAAYFAWQSM